MIRNKAHKSARGVKARAPKARVVVLPKPQKSWLLAGTALATGMLAAGFLASAPSVSYAANECGNQVDDGTADLIVCGTGPFGAISYTLNDPLTLQLQSTQVTNDGVTINTVNDNITVETTDHPDFPEPNIVGVPPNHGLDITSSGSANIIVTHNVGTIVADKDGIRAIQDGAGTGDITITNFALVDTDGTDEADGIEANILNAASAGDIVVKNYGSIGTFGDKTGDHGIFANNDGTGTIEIRNLSTSSIHAIADGIHAEGNGGQITVFNGDNSTNIPPIPNNPDGFIDAAQDGIDITNINGGDINITNGFVSNSQSTIFADGTYGIFANSTGVDVDGNAGRASVVNNGLVETEGDGADAGMWAGSGNGLGWVIGANGANNADEALNLNARINGYDLAQGGVFSFGDANGIELHKAGGEGAFSIVTKIFDPVGETFAIGAAVVNDGTWDFTGDDDYITPGFAEGFEVDLGTEASTTGGVFALDGSGVLIRNFGNDLSAVINRGTIIGEGSFGDPVLDLHTSFSQTGGAVDGSGGGTGAGNFTLLLNASTGVIGSTALPNNWPIGLSEAMATNFGFQSGGGVDWALVNDLIESGELARFGDAALDRLATVTGARLVAQNDGLLVGAVGLFTTPNATLAGVGTHFVNNGSWFTLGFNQFFGGEDYLRNNGLIQASFLQDKNSGTFFQGLDQVDNYGVISLLDGGAGDTLVFDGNYTGGGILVDEEYGGFFALDAFLASSKGAGADQYFMGDASGSTGLIIRNSNPDGSPTLNTFGIDVVDPDSIGNDLDAITNPCSISTDGGDSALCRDGDVFFISSLTPNSFSLGGGVNGIEQGLTSWTLWQDNVWEDFELRQTFVSPGSINAPGIITGAQNIWYSTVSVVEDHSYGHQFANSGGGGADLATEPVYEAPAATSGGTRTGLWVKATGSWIDRDTTVTELGVPIDTSSSQDIYSVLGGADMKWTPDSPWRIGLYGGYLNSGLDFDLGGDSVDYEGGTVGGYLAFNNGAFYADATVKGDLLNADYSFSTVDVDADVTNIGVLANTGYRMNWGGAFFEPIGSLAYVHSEVDDVSTGGATVDFSNGQSFRLGGGARLGTTFATGGGTTELSLLGKVWNEFEDANEVTVTDGLNTATFSDDISGVFGEVSATVVVTDSSGTLSGFLTGGGKFGEDFTSWDAQAGIRKGF